MKKPITHKPRKGQYNFPFVKDVVSKQMTFFGKMQFTPKDAFYGNNLSDKQRKKLLRMCADEKPPQT